MILPTQVLLYVSSLIHTDCLSGRLCQTAVKWKGSSQTAKQCDPNCKNKTNLQTEGYASDLNLMPVCLFSLTWWDWRAHTRLMHSHTHTFTHRWLLKKRGSGKSSPSLCIGITALFRWKNRAWQSLPVWLVDLPRYKHHAREMHFEKPIIIGRVCPSTSLNTKPAPEEPEASLRWHCLETKFETSD